MEKNKNILNKINKFYEVESETEKAALDYLDEYANNNLKDGENVPYDFNKNIIVFGDKQVIKATNVDGELVLCVADYFGGDSNAEYLTIYEIPTRAVIELAAAIASIA